MINEEREDTKRKFRVTKRFLLKTILVLCIGLIVTVGAYSIYHLHFEPYGQMTEPEIGVSEVSVDGPYFTNNTSFDWGILYRGANNTKTLYVNNTGNCRVVLDYTFTQPTTATTEWIMFWDYDYVPLEGMQSRSINFTLYIPEDEEATDSVSWDFDIFATANP